ncbi:hypothetical protein LDENG_00226180 [Lucifuga dentata]|nr:hypothetical protein LDENG_00226180 [Lucifuga dentata]
MRNLRSANQGFLAVPRSQLKTKGNRAFTVVATQLWKSLPQSLREANSVHIFKKLLKTHLFSRFVFCLLCFL